MNNGFRHSVKVPRLYKTAAKIIQRVQEDHASLKQLVYEKKHPNIAAIYALALTTIQHGSQLDELLRKTQLLFKEPRLDAWMARTLIAELLWGKGSLSSEAKPIQTILSYETGLREELKNLESSVVGRGVKEVKKPRYVRINTLVTDVEECIRSFEEEGWTLLPKSDDYSAFLVTLSRLKDSWFLRDFHVPELLVFPAGTQFFRHPAYKCGAIVLQDKASCLPAFLLQPTPGSTVLDMCSAPGMKTSHLAAIMENQGQIFAIEMDKRRFESLCKLVGDTNATCVKAVNADALTIKPKEYPNIEYILVDPSCSGSGITDRPLTEDPNVKCPPGRLRSLRAFQVFLLRHALSNFPTVKRVIYSTCSMHPEENEMVIDEILESIGDSYRLLPTKNLLNDQWHNFSSKDYSCGDRCLYARPEVDRCNGFFVAVFERNFNVDLPVFRKTPAKGQMENGDEKRFDEQRSKGKKRKHDSIGEKSLESNGNLEKSENDEQEVNNKKKKKRRNNKLNGTEYLITKVDNDEQQEQNISKKKHKKSKSKGLEKAEEENVEVENDTEQNIPKKKHKKSKSKGLEKAEEQNFEVENDTEQNIPKQKRKKNKLINSEETIDETVATDHAIVNDGEEVTLTKKKRDERKIESAEVDSQHFPGGEKKKKKKKKQKVDTL